MTQRGCCFFCLFFVFVFLGPRNDIHDVFQSMIDISWNTNRLMHTVFDLKISNYCSSFSLLNCTLDYRSYLLLHNGYVTMQLQLCLCVYVHACLYMCINVRAYVCVREYCMCSEHGVPRAVADCWQKWHQTTATLIFDVCVWVFFLCLELGSGLWLSIKSFPPKLNYHHLRNKIKSQN